MNEILQWAVIGVLGVAVLTRMEILFFLDRRLIKKSKERDNDK